MPKNTVVIGFLGNKLDRLQNTSISRWSNWRPSVSLFRHPDLLIHRFHLIHDKRFTDLAKQVCEDIAVVSPKTEVMVHLMQLKDPWDFQEVFSALLDFAEEYSFNQDDEEYLIHITTGTHVIQICEFLLTEARYFPAKLIQTSPPVKKNTDQPGTYQVIDLDLSKYDRLAMRFQKRSQDDISFLKSGIDTRNPVFNALIEKIEQVAAKSKEPILLTGPTGAGKSRLARRIYELKKTRRQIDGPFVEVNCATLRGDTAMSTLFGHIKGAFTGAMQNREGLLRTANRGMLFLDEIGELGLDEQAMLLRAIEEKCFSPLGCDHEATSDFQLICGTNLNLHEAIEKRRFRKDLFSRINLWTFDFPGLAERPEDIEPNLRYELERFADRNGTRVTMNKEAMEEFLAFATSSRAVWTSNFRDLIGAVTRMATLAPQGRITLDTVRAEIAHLEQGWGEATDIGTEENLSAILGEKAFAPLDIFDQAQLAQVIKVCRKSKSLSDAGRKLFAVSRTKRKSPNDADRLRKYLAKFSLEWNDLRQS